MKALRLWRAAVDTRHFSFEAYGATPEQAKDALRTAWRVHVRQTGADSKLIENDVEDLTPYEVRAGWAFRDCEIITKARG